MGGGGVGRRGFQLLFFWCDDEKYASEDAPIVVLLLYEGRLLLLPGSRVMGTGVEDRQGGHRIVVVVVG